MKNNLILTKKFLILSALLSVLTGCFAEGGPVLQDAGLCQAGVSTRAARPKSLVPFSPLLATPRSSVSARAVVTLTVSSPTDNPIAYPGGQADFDGGTSGDLRYCLNYILNEQVQGVVNDYQIVFAPGINLISLNAKLSMINLAGSDNITIGNADPNSPVTITGATLGTGGFFIRQGQVTIQNMNFQNLSAQGGNGGDGGGGGMGAGGALFIDTANVVLHNVNFSNNSAISGLGNGTGASGGGGGGLGGNGGETQGGGGGYGGKGGDGGGGYYGAGGGAGGDGGSFLGGGGGAILGTTGGIGGAFQVSAVTIAPNNFSGTPLTPFYAGGGGYGSDHFGAGGTGAGGGNVGGLGGTDGSLNLGGSGGNAGLPQMGGSGIGGNGTSTPTGDAGSDGLLGGLAGLGGVFNNSFSNLGSGGGGGGGYSGGGGGGGMGDVSGTDGGGGGGGAGIGGGGGGGFAGNGGTAALCGGNGGNGSIGGGGGGGGCAGGGGGGGFGFGGIANAGNGGDGGGGGGSYSGGLGGYGGGGGHGSPGGFGGGSGHQAGSAGFGGGGGTGALGGFGGGGGANATGGTGASASTVIQGGNAAALGGAIFLGSVNAQPTLTLSGNSSTALNSTSNNAGTSFAGGDDFFLYSGTTLNLMPGANETISLSRSIVDDSVQSIPLSPDWVEGNGSGANLQITGTGTVTLGGTNSYIGTTIVSSGTLNLQGLLYAGGAGPSSQVIVSAGALLEGNGTVNAPTTVLGTITGNIYFNAPLSLPGSFTPEINPTPGSNGQITSTSTVDLTGSTILIAANAGTYVVGAQYTLLTSAGLTGTASLSLPANFHGELSYPNNSVVLTLTALGPATPGCVSATSTLAAKPTLMQRIISRVKKVFAQT